MTDALVVAAARGLVGARASAATAEMPVEAMLQRAEHVGLLGLLADAARSGAVAVGQAELHEIQRRHEVAMVTCLHLEDAMRAATSTLAGAGIPVVVVGGIAAAHLDYADPALRTFGDVDLLVADGAAATDALLRSGWRRMGSTRRLVDERGRQVELHAEADVAGGGAVRRGELFEAARVLDIGGHEVPVLDDDARLVAAAVRAMRTPRRRLLLIRDVVGAVLSRTAPPHDVLQLAERWRVSCTLAEAVAAGWQLFEVADVVGLSVWAEREAGARGRAPTGRSRHWWRIA